MIIYSIFSIYWVKNLRGHFLIFVNFQYLFGWSDSDQVFSAGPISLDSKANTLYLAYSLLSGRQMHDPFYNLSKILNGL